MELDLTGIHKLAAEQGIDPETLDDALAEALRLAYLKTPHAAKHARVELDERSGNFTVWAADEIPVEPTEDNPYPAPKLGEEYDDTPRDFGRLAAATARQVITQLFRIRCVLRPKGQAHHRHHPAGCFRPLQRACRDGRCRSHSASP